MASLFVIQGRDQGRRFELEAAAVGVGRDLTNPIQLHDTEVSRRHAEIRREGQGFWLLDLGSSNGSYVNNERVQRHELRSGDRVLVGRTLMLFTGPDAGATAGLSAAVDIVAAARESAESRILKSVPHDSHSDLFSPPVATESPWLARARSNLQVMYRTALAVSHTLDIDQLLECVLELIFEWVEADRGCIMLVDRESQEPMPRARRNRAGHDDKMLISRTILDYVMQRKEGVLTSDAREDQRWDAGGSIVKFGVREAICVPMQGRYGVVGVIYIDTFTPPGKLLVRRGADSPSANKFSEEHLKLMVAIAHQAALAVEDTNYYSAMVQAERLAAVGQTIAFLSHHIKNILQGIRGGSYLIEEGLKAESFDIVGKGWRIVEKNQDKISALVMDMLSYSKPREPERDAADLNQVTSDVVELMESRAEEAGVALVWQPATDMPLSLFDPEALHRAILNVVTNAIDACEKTPGGGRVVVSARRDPGAGMLHVVVEDNGTGIEAEDIPKIFEVFESRKGARGTGLGLPVSQKILREHNGDILVDSIPGAGATFTLRFPQVAVPTEPAPLPPVGDTLVGDPP